MGICHPRVSPLAPCSLSPRFLYQILKASLLFKLGSWAWCHVCSEKFGITFVGTFPLPPPPKKKEERDLRNPGFTLLHCS